MFHEAVQKIKVARFMDHGVYTTSIGQCGIVFLFQLLLFILVFKANSLITILL